MNENSKQPSEQVTLHVRSGSGGERTALATACWLVDNLGLADWRGWFEPFPGLRPDGCAGRADFDPWTRHWPDNPAQVPELAEIRIGGHLPGGRLGGCHVIQDEDPNGEPWVSWFAFAECQFDGATAQTGVEKAAPYRVLARRDGMRRFFAEGKAPRWLTKAGKLELVEYWRGERLLAWLVVEARG